MYNEKNEERGKAVIKQFERLKAVRDPLDKQYQDCYDYTYPTLGVGFQSTEAADGVSAAQTTKEKQSKLFDSTGTDAVRLLSSSVLSSLTPPTTRWFSLALSNFDEEELDQDGREWLEDAAEQVHTMVHASNYDAESVEFMTHEMIAGMAGIYVELKDSKYFFEAWPLSSLYVADSTHKGRIDTVYRAFHWTVQEAVNEFGLMSLPDYMQEEFARDPYSTKKHKFIVCIRPRIKSGKQSEGKTRRSLPWESLWVAPCGSIVKEAGFHEMPVIIPRWMRIPGTDYARGPVFDALPDIKSLNAVKEKMHLNMDMHIAGMWKAKDDGIFNPATVKIGPRRIIPVGDMDNLQELKSGGDISFAMQEIANMQASIRRVLLADQLGPTEKAIMTATEVQTRNNQVRQILGPIFARLQSEYLSPLVERCFGLAMRAGLLPTPPESLREKILEIEYRSPLARSQKMQELEAVDAFVTRVTTTAMNTQKAELLDHINWDKVVQKSGYLLGVDPELLNDDKSIKKQRMERAKAQQQAAMAQAAAAQSAQAPRTQAQANEETPEAPPMTA